jgi:hypothetical protein
MTRSKWVLAAIVISLIVVLFIRRVLDVPAVIDRLTGSVTATSPAGRSLWLMYRRCPRCRPTQRLRSC